MATRTDRPGRVSGTPLRRSGLAFSLAREKRGTVRWCHQRCRLGSLEVGVFARSTSINAQPSMMDNGIAHVRDTVMPGLSHWVGRTPPSRANRAQDQVVDLRRTARRSGRQPASPWRLGSTDCVWAPWDEPASWRLVRLQTRHQPPLDGRTKLRQLCTSYPLLAGNAVGRSR
jgi:hypothetical protein